MYSSFFSQKYLTRFFSLLFLFATCSLASLHAQKSTPTPAPDPMDQEFSGPLAVIPDLVTVGDPGNLADPSTGLGAVKDTFEVGKYPVTQLQWSTFLNAVCVIEGNPLDPRNLYHPEMFSTDNPTSYLTVVSGIIKKAITTDVTMQIYDEKVTYFFPQNWGTATGHDYGSLPITGITINDCKRYANWLHNGAPSFKQLDDATLAATETGAYDFTNGKNGELLPDARYFIPDLNQWYKAAYYKTGNSSAGYWKYPTKSNVLPFETPHWSLFLDDHQLKTGANFATLGSGWPFLKFYYRGQIRGVPLTTPVGVFKDSPGPYATFDMGGNVREWTSAFLEPDKASSKESTFNAPTPWGYLTPGGSYDDTSDQLLSINAVRHSCSTSNRMTGFRIAAKAGVCDTPTQLDSGSFTPVNNNPSLDPKLLRKNAFNITVAQLTSYGLEAAIKTVLALGTTGALPAFSDVIVSFTYQRNMVNAILSVVLATSSTGEVNFMNIQKADFWSAALIATTTAVTMIATEGSAFAVEAVVGKILSAVSDAGWLKLTVRDSVQTLAWPRILVNVWYIGSNTYMTTDSDLEYFNTQQKLLQQQSQDSNSSWGYTK